MHLSLQFSITEVCQGLKRWSAALIAEERALQADQIDDSEWLELITNNDLAWRQLQDRIQHLRKINVLRGFNELQIQVTVT